jgi:predicted DNA-binding transcriptional regulator YafY
VAKSQRRVSRLLEIILALETGEGWSSVDLAKRFGVSRTQIFNDIRALREAGVPILRTGDGYKLDDSFHLPPLRLSPREVLALVLPMDALGADGAGHRARASAQEKLIACLPETLQPGVRELVERTSVVIPSSEPDEEIAATIRGAVMEHRRLAIIYTSRYRRNPRRLEVDPYGLAFRKHAWYLVAFSTEHGEVRKFRLSRISAIEATGLRFTPPEDFSVDQVFAGAFYVFSGHPQEIRLRFSPRVARFVRERRPLPEQRIQTLSDGSILFRAEVNNLDEVAWWLVQYGGDAYVQHPPALRDRVLSIAGSILTRHGVAPPQFADGQFAPRPYPRSNDQGMGRVADGDDEPQA